MRDPLKDTGRLQHMLDMALLLENEKRIHSLQSIKEDTVLFYGLSKMIEIIGEAAYKITHEFKAANPQLPWREIEGMRHILVHGYYQISAEMLWDVIQNDIPALIPILKGYLNNYDSIDS
ncbi:MAG: DUF86 domain-containing protein [Bacteroides sp.]|nr:DUF86 domain-containing protein [Bacteroides sp.]